MPGFERKSDKMTKISGINQNQIIKIYANSKRPEESAKKTFSQAADTVEISRETREMQALREKITQVPEIREEKIMELQKQLKEGKYRIDLDQLAENLFLEIKSGIKK